MASCKYIQEFKAGSDILTCKLQYFTVCIPDNWALAGYSNKPLKKENPVSKS